MERLVPLLIRIGLANKRDKDGNEHLLHDFPDLNRIDPSIRDGLDWSYYVDRYSGWHYDQTCGHAEESPESPRGVWCGMLMVPENFADQALALFPDQITELTETEAAEFYETKAHIRDPAVLEDVQTLQSIEAKRAVGIPETDDDRNALDPDHPMPGRRRNKEKTWSKFMTNRGFALSDRVRQPEPRS